MMRRFTLSVFLTATLFNIIAADKPTIFTPYGGAKIYTISDNGQWGLSETAGDDEADNPKPKGGSLFNLNNNTAQTITYDGSWASVSYATNDGTVLGTVDGVPGKWDPSTKAWTLYPVSDDWDGGNILNGTPDGHFAVGIYTDDNDFYHVHPFLLDLTTGQYLETNNLPPVDLNGVNSGQNAFYSISPDGRYCIGQMSQSYWLPVSPLAYVYDTLNDTWRPIGYDYDETTQKYTPRDSRLHFIINSYMSSNGEWVTGTAYVVTGDNEFKAAYRYNIDTDTFELFADKNDEDYAGNKITNDGTILANAPADNPYPTAYVRSGKFYVSLDEILEQVYGMKLEDQINDYVTGSFQALSGDGLTAAMQTYDNCYIIKMPESFAEAAAKVELLNRFTLSIPEGTAMNKISEIKLNFDRDICVFNDPQSARLLDEDGNLVRNSSGFALSAASSNQLVVTFRSTNLTPGKKYTVNIPAERLWLLDDPTIKSEEINITYVGRTAEPVKAVKVSPVDGSALSMLNSSTDYIVVTYDCQVNVSETGSATLYDDSNNAIADLSAIADGDKVFFFPTSAYYLYKGTNYQVVISQGSVTDCSGQGGSDELVLNYTGTYVRTLSTDDKYVYYNTCDTYDNFMMWKNEVHTPGLIPQGWGFDADNMWMLTRENDETSDWVMTAHSMFNSPAQSDDWLVTPQLFIPDANTYLAFDAQSYLKDKEDVLRVYVYATDAVYNNLSSEITNRMRDEGELLLEKRLSPGAYEERLSGDWERFIFNLDKYAGRNIYIAFVNYNYDQSAIFLDNIEVTRDINFLITNRTPSVVVGENSQTVSGIMSIISELANFEGITFNLLDSEGNLVSQISDPEAQLEFGDTYNFSFPNPLPLNVGYESEYTIQIISGTTNNTFKFDIKDLAFNPVKKVILEEFGGMDCPNCPLGILGIDNLHKLYGDQLLPINIRAYQGSDPLGAGVTDYASALGFTAAPSGRLNRGETLAPMVSTTNGYQYIGNGIIDSDGKEVYLWADAMADAMLVAAEADIQLSASYDPDTKQVNVPCDVKFAINTSNRSISVFGVVLEDDLPAVQINNFYKTSDPNLGEWGYGGIYASYRVRNWRADDVARFPLCGNSYNGTLLPYSSFNIEDNYSITLSGTIPEGRILNPDKCKVTVMIIDNATGKVINANQAAFGTSGISDIVIDSNNECVYYNLQGFRVSHPEKGSVYIKVQGQKATKIIF